MKATGIVRRIDDLGRIVIPKEIRRTLRIRESDPLEIFTDREGEIILKKYSPIGEMNTFAKQYTESLAQVTGQIAVIADRDQIIATSGGLKSLMGKQLSPELEEVISERKTVQAVKTEKAFITLETGSEKEYFAEIIVPIICEGDAIGAIAILTKDEKTKLSETELKLTQAGAAFLGRQMEQ